MSNTLIAPLKTAAAALESAIAQLENGPSSPAESSGFPADGGSSSCEESSGYTSESACASDYDYHHTSQSAIKQHVMTILERLFERYTENLDFESEDYSVYSLIDEKVRVIYTAAGSLEINDPVLLVVHRGGKTHRVVDVLGKVWCYAAPETGQSFLEWHPRNPSQPVQF